MAEDYGPCRNCGTPTDSGCCSPECANELEAALAARRAAKWEAAGLCTNCGEQPCSTCRRCHDCEDLEDHEQPAIPISEADQVKP